MCNQIILVLFAAAVMASAQETNKGTSRVQANQENFTIPDAKASFIIPKHWLLWKRYFALDSSALSRVQADVKGEWDSAYGPITDAILPFTDCLLHIGNDGWGSHGSAWSDVQMRAYVTDTKPEAISKAVATKGVETAKTKGWSVKSTSRDEDGWRVDHVGFDLSYGDYGGRAGVYLYSRLCRTGTLVLVFMLADHEPAIKDRDSILKSFRMESN